MDQATLDQPLRQHAASDRPAAEPEAHPSSRSHPQDQDARSAEHAAVWAAQVIERVVRVPLVASEPAVQFREGAAQPTPAAEPRERGLVLALLCHLDGLAAAALLGAPERVTIASADRWAPSSDSRAAERLRAALDVIRCIVSTSGSKGLRAFLALPAGVRSLKVAEILARGSLDEIAEIRAQYLRRLRASPISPYLTAQGIGDTSYKTEQ